MTNKNFIIKDGIDVGGHIILGNNLPNLPNGVVLLDSNGKLPPLDGSNLTGLGSVASGEQVYTTPGTYSWVCPAGVTSVSVVCVGGGGGGSTYPGNGGAGGGLGWKNNIAVTPGSSYTVVVGAGGIRAVAKVGGSAGTDPTGLPNNGNEGGPGGNSYFINTSTVCGYGGAGGLSNNSTINFMYGGNYVGTGGGKGGDNLSTSTQGNAGGAGGYSGQGGSYTQSTNIWTDGTGGGGGSSRYPGGDKGAGAGGVGIFGQGANGQAGNTTTYYGVGGSGGETGTSGSSYNPKGGNYGGGGGWNAGYGGSGAVRIIWGTGRSFPNNAA